VPGPKRAIRISTASVGAGCNEFDKADPVGRLFEVPSKTATKSGVVLRVARRAVDERPRSYVRATDRSRSTRCTWARGVACPRGQSQSHLPRDGRAASGVLRGDGLHHVQFLPVMEHPFYGLGIPDDGLLRTDVAYATPTTSSSSSTRCTRRASGATGLGALAFLRRPRAGMSRTHLYEHADVRQRVHRTG